MVIGITGGIGSGKSQILAWMRQEAGADVIQTDQVAAALEKPGEAGLALLVQAFGRGILDQKGELDRPALARRLFADPSALQRVNEEIHPLVWREVRRLTAEAGKGLQVVESALFDEESRKLCDHLVFVDVEEERRIRRLMAGRGYSREKCLEIMATQPSRQQFLALSDYIIDNNGTAEETEKQLRQMLRLFSGLLSETGRQTNEIG